MPAPHDNIFKTQEFKQRLSEADVYAAENSRDRRATRVCWIALTFSPLVAKRFSRRVGSYWEKPAWKAWTNLIEAGALCDDPEGIPWEESLEDSIWGDDMLWFDTWLGIAEGRPAPENFPLFIPAQVAH